VPDHPRTGNKGFFVVLEFPESVDTTLAYWETNTDGIYLKEPDEVAR
jgi:hypothetical protein